MTAHRPIDTTPFADGLASEDLGPLGPAPMLQWIAVEMLVIDPSYQREIQRNGARNVLAIAQNFSWTKFAPVIVASVEGGRYAIVDGQHRTTAAALRGAKEVPCQVILADKAEQAAAFAAVNGNITQMTSQQIYAARLAALDPGALALQAACSAGGVTILRHPVPASKMKTGETLAVNALERSLSAYGADIFSLALRCITRTGKGNAGLIRASLINAICSVLDSEPQWASSEEKLIQAFDRINLGTLYDESVAGARRDRGTALPAMVKRLYIALEPKLGPVK